MKMLELFSPWMLFIIGVLLTVLGFLLKGAINSFATELKRVKEKMDEFSSDIKKDIGTIYDKMGNLEKEMLSSYVRRTEMIHNNSAHEKIWVELNDIKNKQCVEINRIDTLDGRIEKIEEKISEINTPS